MQTNNRRRWKALRNIYILMWPRLETKIFLSFFRFHHHLRHSFRALFCCSAVPNNNATMNTAVPIVWRAFSYSFMLRLATRHLHRQAASCRGAAWLCLGCLWNILMKWLDWNFFLLLFFSSLFHFAAWNPKQMRIIDEKIVLLFHSSHNTVSAEDEVSRNVFSSSTKLFK